MSFNRVCLIVLDSAGIGEMPDAAEWGDAGADTIGHILASRKVDLPNLQRLGLGNIRPLNGIAAVRPPLGSYGKCTLKSNGKDTTTGHWEMAGIVLKKPFQHTHTDFRRRIIDEFIRQAKFPAFWQRPGLWDRDNQATRRRARSHGQADRLYLGRFRVSDRRT